MFVANSEQVFCFTIQSLFLSDTVIRDNEGNLQPEYILLKKKVEDKNINIFLCIKLA